MLETRKAVLLATVSIGIFLLLDCSPLQPETPQPIDTATPSARPTSTPKSEAEDCIREAQVCLQRWRDSQTDQDYQCAIENIVKAIHAEPREEYVEFLYKIRLENPPPTIPVGAVMDIYTDTIDTARFFTQTETTTANLSLSETQIPALVHSGEKALRLQWDKPSDKWASLIIGFDLDIQNRDKAMIGQMKRLGIDESTKDSYRLEFWIMGAEGGEAIAVKLQDQNPVITESIGCQVHEYIVASSEWKTISIPLPEFYLDYWIREKRYRWYKRFLKFEWDGIKQINFDPYFYSDSGIVYLDNIRLAKVAK
jgi:hypothetical protein